MQRAIAIASMMGLVSEKKMRHAFSSQDFAVIHKGITRWKHEGKQEALWLNYGNNTSAERARYELIKSHHVQDADVLGGMVIVNGGIDYLESEIESIAVHKRFHAKLRAALQQWRQRGGKKPLVLEFLHSEEVGFAKEELKDYISKDSENAIAYGSKLIMSEKLALELEEVAA